MFNQCRLGGFFEKKMPVQRTPFGERHQCE